MRHTGNELDAGRYAPRDFLYTHHGGIRLSLRRENIDVQKEIETMSMIIKNKSTLEKNIKLLKDIVLEKDKDPQIQKDIKKDGASSLFFLIFKEKDIGYVSLIVESNGMLSYMYLSFFDIDQHSHLDFNKVNNICNEVNKVLSPSRLLINDNKVYSLCTFPLDLMEMKKDHMRSVLSTFKKAVENSVEGFRELEQPLSEELKNKKSIKNNISGD